VASDGFRLYPGIGYKVKDPSKTGKAKVKSEGSIKYGKSQKTALVKRVQEIDRENDEYKESVTNAETGEIIHSCEEPLSSHTGHGSAKKEEPT